jgi:hypothetical protein
MDAVSQPLVKLHLPTLTFPCMTLKIPITQQSCFFKHETLEEGGIVVAKKYEKQEG